MNSKEYIADCLKKVGEPKKLVLNIEQTAVLQGLLGGAVSSGRALSHLKKDVFEYHSMRVSGELCVDEQVNPLTVEGSRHIALRSILGMQGELADITENLYLWINGSKEIDIDNLKIDLGDLSFYASLLLHIISSDWEEVQILNRKKTDNLYNRSTDQ